MWIVGIVQAAVATFQGPQFGEMHTPGHAIPHRPHRFTR